jgi:hypothetical protein
MAEIELTVDLLSDKILAVKIRTDNDVPEFHAITGESASFVSQNVMNLTQLLINTYCMTLSLTVINPTIHLLVPLHKNSLEHLDKLQRHNQRNGYEGVVKNVIRTEGDC